MSSPNLILATSTILGSEKALGLYEIHEQSPNYRGFHRYQILHVVRDGKICEFRKDMGLASKYKGVKQLRIPSYMEHTVDELLDIADTLRTETFIDIKDWLELESYKLA